MKIAIIGASGFVGGVLVKELKNEHNVIGTFHSKPEIGLIRLDICCQKEVTAFFSTFAPDVVILTAAFPNVNMCEQYPNKSRQINVIGSENVAKACKKVNSKLIFFSTDYIFDGKNGPYSEDSKANPINVYGKHKLEAEQTILKLLNNSLIIRTCNIYGYETTMKNFVMSLSQDLLKGIKKNIPDDQFGCPTYVNDLVKGIRLLLNQKKSGIFHIAGPEWCSRFDFAKEIAKAFNYNINLLTRSKTTTTEGVAPRPMKSGLKIDKMKSLNFIPTNIQDGLKLTVKNYEIHKNKN